MRGYTQKEARIVGSLKDLVPMEKAIYIQKEYKVIVKPRLTLGVETNKSRHIIRTYVCAILTNTYIIIINNRNEVY